VLHTQVSYSRSQSDSAASGTSSGLGRQKDVISLRSLNLPDENCSCVPSLNASPRKRPTVPLVPLRNGSEAKLKKGPEHPSPRRSPGHSPRTNEVLTRSASRPKPEQQPAMAGCSTTPRRSTDEVETPGPSQGGKDVFWKRKKRAASAGSRER